MPTLSLAQDLLSCHARFPLPQLEQDPGPHWAPAGEGMAAGERDVLMLSAMDQLVARVRKWKAADAAFGGAGAAQDVALAHSGELLDAWRASGLQAWEFHTMLHRAAEYGLVEDMQPLWSEVRAAALVSSAQPCRAMPCRCMVACS
jgi:hypothetical protein